MAYPDLQMGRGGGGRGVSFRPQFGLKISGLGPFPGPAIDFAHNSVTPNIKRNWLHFFSTLTNLSTLPVAINWDYCNAGFTGPGTVELNCRVSLILRMLIISQESRLLDIHRPQ